MHALIAMRELTRFFLLFLIIVIVKRRGLLGQFEVVLALLPHAVGIGAACVPLYADPAVLTQLPDHTPISWRGSVLIDTNTIGFPMEIKYGI